jgi:hypothetical protein
MFNVALFVNFIPHIVACRKLLLGNDRENNETTAGASQRSALNNGSTLGSGIFCVVCSEPISRDRPSLHLTYYC